MTIVAQIKADIAKLQLQLNTVQSECTHPPSALQKVPKSDGGNCDNVTSYWYNCHCLLCDKTWTENQ